MISQYVEESQMRGLKVQWSDAEILSKDDALLFWERITVADFSFQDNALMKLLSPAFLC
ncbi:hypothetical protein KP509_30G043800 [Ceratopteris richardii]|uniref:Uncharacterized protein n=1 Tax=Ceratopteris richardii TaxID=49495 RepID=A0A8T2R2Z7_CERRI|nr:hypothetical protein KP509_30G043800 [Ceratopteris richardii]